jgi:ATP-dependent Clp protease adaptor protein ClpS
MGVAMSLVVLAEELAMSDQPALPEVTVIPKPRTTESTRTRRIPPYNVLLCNDDHHTCEWVVEVLMKSLGYSTEKAVQLMWQAHTDGQAVVWTGSREVAELKYDQIRSFHEIREPEGRNLGPLDCRIEPAPGA